VLVIHLKLTAPAAALVLRRMPPSEVNELKSPCISYMLPPSFYEYLYYMKEQEYQEVDEKEECCLFLTPSERIVSAAYCIKAQVDVKSSTV